MWIFLDSSGCSLVQKSLLPAVMGTHREENKKNRAAEFQSLRFVRMVRVELTQANAHYPLKVACLPFHHIRISCENQVSLSLWDCKYRHCLVNSKIFSRFI